MPVSYTHLDVYKRQALPFVAIDPPTIVMQFAVNDGPLAGREGEHVTSRKIRDRLDREQKMNVTISVKDTDTAGIFDVSARGAMQIAVLVEQMRREGFEVLVSRPMVIMKRINDVLCEPFETLFLDAVSYTHLDVYKRQVQRIGRGRSSQGDRTGRVIKEQLVEREAADVVRACVTRTASKDQSGRTVAHGNAGGKPARGGIPVSRIWVPDRLGLRLGGQKQGQAAKGSTGGPVSYTHLDVYKRQTLVTLTSLAFSSGVLPRR